MLGFILTLLISSQINTTYKLADFRIPESGTISFDFGVDLGIKDTASNGSSSGLFYEEYTNVGSENAYTGFLLQKESDRRGFSVSASLSLAGNQKDGVTYYYEPQAVVETLSIGGLEIWDTLWYNFNPHAEDAIESADLNEYFTLSGDWCWYPFREFMFIGFGGGVSGTHSFGDQASRGFLYEDTSLYTFDTSLTQNFTFGLDAYPLFGFGKLRPLEYPSRALEIARVVSEESAGREDPAMVQDLAVLLARRWTYPVKYWHPDWEFYQNMEEIFTRYGIGLDNLHARTWLRIIEASSIWGSGRPFGLRLTLKPVVLNQYLESRHAHRSNKHSSSGSEIYFYHLKSNEYVSSIIAGSIELAGGYPINNSMHLSGHLAFEPFLSYEIFTENRKELSIYRYKIDSLVQDTTIISKHDTLKEYVLDYNMTYTVFFMYSLSLNAGIEGRINHYKEYNGRLNMLWSNKVFLGINYDYLNRFSVSATGSLNLYRRENEDLLFPYAYLAPQVSLGMNYRIF